MKQVTLHIPDKQYSFFMELVTHLGFAKKVVREDNTEHTLADFKEAVRQINLVKQGKLKARDARELLDEL